MGLKAVCVCRNQYLLILDLDETLVYATEQELATQPDFRVAQYAVYRRPHLEEFLNYCFEDFEVAVWTSSGRGYATEVVAQILPNRELRFFWTADRCTQRFNWKTHDPYVVKNLAKIRKLGIQLERVLMVDDSAEKLERQYGNHILIPPYEGDLSDGEIAMLADYLRSIRDCPNYRTVEKRN